jgi:hypothetical protein
LRSIIGDYIKTLVGQEIPSIENWKVPLGVATANLNRTKVTRENNKDVSRVVKPSKPSERLEVLMEFEKNQISKTESCFKDLHILSEKNAHGVNPEDLNSFRKDYKSLLDKCWQVVAQWSPVLTARRTFLVSYAPKRKNITWNKSQMLTLIRSIDWSEEDVKRTAFVLHYLAILQRFNEISEKPIDTTSNISKMLYYSKSFMLSHLTGGESIQAFWYSTVGEGISSPVEDIITDVQKKSVQPGSKFFKEGTTVPSKKN